MKLLLFIFAFVLLYIAGMAQDGSKLPQNNPADFVNQDTASLYYRYNIGIGSGMDYGGIGGVKLTYVIMPYASVFAAGGYALVGLGYNIGGTFRALPNKKICPYVSAMYGYNAVIQVVGASMFDEIFHGFSFSLGSEIRSKKLKNYFNVEVIVPIRPHVYEVAINQIQRNRNIIMSSEPLPVGISLGYHFVF